MNPDASPIGSTRHGWRLVTTMTQPTDGHDPQWAARGLKAALSAFHLPPWDLESLAGATEEAVMLAGFHTASPGGGDPHVVVQVFVSSPRRAAPALYGWGFFIVERVTDELSVTTWDPPQSPMKTRCIGVYVYADEGSE